MNRFGAAITQLFPLIGIHLGVSLQSVAILYSISFIVFYFGSFLFTWFVLDNPKIAIVILLFNTLITTHSFFWIQCELVQGAVFTLIYLASIELQIKKGFISNLFYAFSPIALITIVFFYPLLPFVLIFGLIFLFLQHRTSGNWLLSIGVSYIVIYFIKISVFKTSYDTNAMNAANNLIDLFPNYFDLKFHRIFAEWLFKDYFFLFIFSVWIIISYILKKEYLKLGFFTLSIIGFTLFINVCYFRGAEQFYLEPQYSILAIFIAFPLSYDIMPILKTKYSTLLLSLIIVTCIGRILITERIYSKRLDWYRSFLKGNNNEKMIVNQKKVPMDLLKMGWSSALEFWLLSTIENKSTASIVFAGEYDFDWVNSSPQVFCIQGGVYKYNDMDKKYFLFKDTINVYKKVKFD
ncbi:MAG: hypothetical protein J7604_25200 [Sporocytophaga sp.]|nr:hypothetical protein [Sporocytophaga sp.]